MKLKEVLEDSALLERFNMYNVLALDQASKTTGYAIFRDGVLYTQGTFSLTDSSVEKRLHKFKIKIQELITDYDIQEVVYEDIYLDEDNKNVNTFKVLAEVYGVLSELLYSLNIYHTSYTASEWKSGCGIKKSHRQTEKKLAQKFVLDKYFINAKEDACDAICIGHHFLNKKQNEINWD